MTNDIFEYMKETSRESDSYTLGLLDRIKEEGKDIYECASHLPILRNRLVNGNMATPKSRNSLGKLIYENLTDEEWQKIIPALAFIELSTISTYVLDDILDGQTERQGDEATWKKFGINKGIVAGNLQTFIAFNGLSDLDINDSEKLRVYKLAHNMWLQLWIGEGFNEEMKEGTTYDEYIKRCYQLCGVMFDTISQISAICAGVDERKIQLVSNIGRNYGIAVMIRNDLVDLLPKIRKHSQALSRDSYEDLRKGIWTYPIIYAVEHCDESDRKIITGTVGKNCDKDHYKKLFELLKKRGAINATLDLISTFKTYANKCIMELPISKSRKLLLDLTGLLENLRGYI